MIEVQTASGSTYIFDTVNKTWERTVAGALLGKSPLRLRTPKGVYNDLEDIEVGKRGTIHAPGLEFGNRWIHTSEIVSVREY